MVSAILLVGIVVAIFVGFNIGGSSTGIAWGPAVGAGVIGKTAAAALMSVFVFVGGWTVGRNVIDTMGSDIVPPEIFTLQASIVVLFFIGLGMLIANLFGVPVPTSMTAVGAIAGLGLATGTLDMVVMGRIISWWVVTPIIAFWIGGIVGRYFYPYLDRYFEIRQSEGPLLALDRSGAIPTPVLGPGTTVKELATTVLIVVIACYMAFGAGASNVANAVAPLVGSGALDIGGYDGTDLGIAIGAVAISLGGFTIARRTMEAVGNDLTELPLLAALIVAVTAASITTILSSIGIPISLVMATVMTIVGLGWGRASRTASIAGLARGEDTLELSTNVLTQETPNEVPKIGEEDPEDVIDADDLVRPDAVARFVVFWIIGPSASAGLAYAFFLVVPI
ncbi:inorganic phosphate transporter [Natrinema salifodinae]|uniref:Phosphate transporter n=1 Tax=Natrinema salifodinae TaxID=1202768 RepID=A0A1I0QI72_9EURY|nr:inorganic phosphate transporter [Natrinema salifodinae]SEW26646.1 inorganic phosphate transporter, PiT family [Natrinema salifodinae]